MSIISSALQRLARQIAGRTRSSGATACQGPQHYLAFALLLLLPAFSIEAHAQLSSEVFPVVNCIEFPPDPSSGTYTAHFGYTNTTSGSIFVPGYTSENFTYPDKPSGSFVTNFLAGYHPDAFVVTGNLQNALSNGGESYFLGFNLQALANPVSNAVDSNGILIPPTPTCVPSAQATPLTYSAPGFYPHQSLATVMFGPQTATPSAVAIDPASNILVANVTYSAGTPGMLYGDVTVTAGPPGTSAVALQLSQPAQAGAPAVTTVVASTVATLSFAGTVASSNGCPVNVTANVKGSFTSPVQLFGTEIYTQLLTIKNVGGTPISGPIEVALNGLSSNAKLFTAGATGTCSGIASAPVIYMTGTLAPGAQGAVVLTFTNTQIPTSAITYTPVILSGGSRL